MGTICFAVGMYLNSEIYVIAAIYLSVSADEWA